MTEVDDEAVGRGCARAGVPTSPDRDLEVVRDSIPDLKKYVRIVASGKRLGYSYRLRHVFGSLRQDNDFRLTLRIVCPAADGFVVGLSVLGSHQLVLWEYVEDVHSHGKLGFRGEEYRARAAVLRLNTGKPRLYERGVRLRGMLTHWPIHRGQVWMTEREHLGVLSLGSGAAGQRHACPRRVRHELYGRAVTGECRSKLRQSAFNREPPPRQLIAPRAVRRCRSGRGGVQWPDRFALRNCCGPAGTDDERRKEGAASVDID